MVEHKIQVLKVVIVLKLRFYIKLALSLFMIFFLIGANAQGSAVIDSLKIELAKLPEDSTKALMYDEICWQYLYSNPDEALKYADSTIIISEKIQFFRGIISGNSNKGGYYYIKSDFDKAVELYVKCDSLSRIYDYQKGIFAANSNIANILYRQGKFDEAIERHIVTMDWAIKNGDTIRIIKAKINKSAVYNGMGDYKKSIKELLEALDLLKYKPKEKKLIGFVQNNLCAGFVETGDYKRAIKYCRNATEYFKEEESFTILPSVLFNLGKSYNEIGKRDSALIMINKGLKYNPTDRTLHYGYSQLGSYFFVENQIDSSLYYNKLAYDVAKKIAMKHERYSSAIGLGQCYWRKKEYQKAYKYYREGIEGLESLSGDQIQLSEGYKEYLILKSKLGYRITVDEMERYVELRDSIFNEEKLAEISEIEAKYQLRQKQDSIQMLTLREQSATIQAKEEKFKKILYLISFLASVLLLGFVFRNFKKEKKIAELSKEKSALLEEKNQELLHINVGLEKKINEAKEKENPLEELGNIFITLSNRLRTIIKLKDIIYVEARDGKIFFITTQGEYSDWSSLVSYEGILPDEMFMRIHGSFIVNILHVSVKPNHQLIMSNGKILKISRQFFEPVVKKLKEFSISLDDLK